MALAWRYDDAAEQELAWLIRRNRRPRDRVETSFVRDVVLQLQMLVPKYLRELQDMARELNRLVELHNDCEALRESRREENTRAIRTSLRGMTLLYGKVQEQEALAARRDSEHAAVEAVSLEQEAAFRAISEVVDAMRPPVPHHHHQDPFPAARSAPSSSSSSSSAVIAAYADPEVLAAAEQQQEAARAALEATSERLVAIARHKAKATKAKERAEKHHLAAVRLYEGVRAAVSACGGEGLRVGWWWWW